MVEEKVNNNNNKLKEYMDKNCMRTKARSKLSYGTMWLTLQQCYKQSKELNYVRLKKKRYADFLSSVKDFMQNNVKCDSNRYWNPKLIEVVFIEKETDYKLFVLI